MQGDKEESQIEKSLSDVFPQSLSSGRWGGGIQKLKIRKRQQDGSLPKTCRDDDNKNGYLALLKLGGMTTSDG